MCSFRYRHVLLVSEDSRYTEIDLGVWVLPHLISPSLEDNISKSDTTYPTDVCVSVCDTEEPHSFAQFEAPDDLRWMRKINNRIASNRPERREIKLI